MDIKIHVSELMGKHKLNQRQLSELTGIRPATVSALYHEEIKRIEINQIASLCKAFNCQPGDLFTYEPNNE